MKDKDLNFEKALADLEQTVDKLEKGKLSLNESLALFEKGVKLARFLRDELDRAEKKIEILLKDEKGEMKREPFDLERDDEDDESGGGEREGAEGAGNAGKSDAGAGDAPAKKPTPRAAKKKPEDDDGLPF
jgi:exodeoxyribonuclease VII small subunit